MDSSGPRAGKFKSPAMKLNHRTLTLVSVTGAASGVPEYFKIDKIIKFIKTLPLEFVTCSPFSSFFRQNIEKYFAHRMTIQDQALTLQPWTTNGFVL